MVLPQRLEALYFVAAKAAEHFSPPVDEERTRIARATKLWLPGAKPLSASGVFDPCGLILEIPPKSGYYWCTPKEALTFACTGGDGVHYSYLSSDSLSPSVVPVVMTLPANDKHNFVVADSIDEFLGLGYHVGWFALEGIAYDPEEALQYFAQAGSDCPDYRSVALQSLGIERNAPDSKSTRLEFLRSHLSIQPVSLSLDRIAELTERYASYLIVPDDPPA